MVVVVVVCGRGVDIVGAGVGIGFVNSADSHETPHLEKLFPVILAVSTSLTPGVWRCVWRCVAC